MGEMGRRQNLKTYFELIATGDAEKSMTVPHLDPERWPGRHITFLIACQWRAPPSELDPGTAQRALWPPALPAAEAMLYSSGRGRVSAPNLATPEISKNIRIISC